MAYFDQLGAKLCEACRSLPAMLEIENDEPTQPYRVCIACAKRLEQRALRPLEWFNLAAIHGPTKHLLHDDFYDDDGHADQPEVPVVGSDRLPAPTLDAVTGDLERLLDFAMSRNYIKSPVLALLGRLDKDEVLSSLQKRVESSRNTFIQGGAFEICEKVVGKLAGPWIREQWADVDVENLPLIARAAAMCLPFEEGFSRVCRDLEALEEGDLVFGCFALEAYRTPKSLDWMELHREKVAHSNWGRVAAASHMNWSRVQAWLELGRPLCLRALEAVLACQSLDTPRLKELAPVIEEPPEIGQMIKTLEAYLARDSVPNVRNKVEAIKRYWIK